MAEDGEVTAGLVRDYFIKNGGKVNRHDLFDHFRSQLDESTDQGKLKNQFGDIVNSLAFLQNFEGEKYFVLKKSKNGTTPVLLRRPIRAPVNQRKEKGVSLPANMRSFRFSSADDANGYIPDNKASPGPVSRYRPGLRSESISAEVSLRRNSSDTSISENGYAQDSGVDTAVSSLQSESPKLGSRHGSLPRSIADFDRLSQYSGDTGIHNEDDQYDHEMSSHVLDGFEKSWMMSSMIGNKSDIVCHIEQEPNIVMYKDFIMGYTGLHWAAKQGNVDIVRLLANAGANVNAKSNGGYTPLHLAAMHGQIIIMDILIDECNVDVHIRDHSGKEPKDVVKKNSPDQIKLKLKDPIAAMDHNSLGIQGGLTRSQELNESTRFMPKLRAGSFRFLKKQKKVKRDRPVIEHWDSSRQERLQSTLRGNEKELYKMERANSGSLFPTSFYSGNRSARSKSQEVQGDVAGDVGLGPNPVEHEINVKAEMLKCRSYPESEFRNITKINEENAQDLNTAHSPVMRSPSGSLSSSSTITYVEPDESLLDSVLSSIESGSSHMPDRENERNRRRSHSEENLSTVKSSFNDELAARLKNDKNTPYFEGQVFDDELATLMTIPKKVPSYEASGKPLNGMVTSRDDEVATKETEEVATKETERRKPSKDSSVSSKPSEDVQSFLTYADEYSTTLTFPNKQQQQQQQQQQQPDQQTETTSHETDQIIPQLNNNYEEVSEILDSEKPRTTSPKYSLKVEQPPERNFSVFSSDSKRPERPPRKKDKRSKNSGKPQENHGEQNNFNAMSEFRGNERATMLSSERYSSEKTDLVNSENRGPVNSDKKLTENINESRSQDFSKSNPDVPRRKSDGYVKVKEISLDHPRRMTDNNFPSGPEAVRVENGNKRVLPEVLLDTSRPSSDYYDGHRSRSLGESVRPTRETLIDRGREEPRILPPYRPSKNMATERGLRKSNEFLSSSENTTNNIHPSLRPSNPLPNEPRQTRRSHEPSNYNSSREVSLDHPKRRQTMNYLTDPPAHTAATTGDERRKSEGWNYKRYPVHDASVDESGSSRRQWTEDNSADRGMTSPGGVDKNRAGREPKGFSHPVDNISSDRRTLNNQTVARNSLETGNYNNTHNITRKNGLYKQSEVNYEQEMATVLVPRDSEPGPSKVAFDYDEPGYIVAKQVSSDDHANEAGQSENKEDLDLLSSFLGEDMTNKWFSSPSSNAMTTEAEQKQMYRVTSMI